MSQKLEPIRPPTCPTFPIFPIFSGIALYFEKKALYTVLFQSESKFYHIHVANRIDSNIFCPKFTKLHHFKSRS